MEAVRTALARAVEYLGEHPEEARYTDRAAKATLESGLVVRIEGEGGEAMVTDMPPSVGGDGSAPSPGWLFRASVAGCVATLIAMRAAHLGVQLSALDVTVDSESDDRGILGMDPSVPAAPLSMGISVHTEGPDEAPIEEIVEWAVKHCPVSDAVRRAVPVSVHTAARGAER
jgi:uncharacterized OsmC-like protein